MLDDTGLPVIAGDLCSRRLQLSGGWQVHPISLGSEVSPERISFSDDFVVPDAAHLQPTLYPDNPFWGEHLRAINEQAWIYRRTFTVPDIPYRRARLHFEGVDYFASVWLNGCWLGRHEGHFAPFSFDITRALRPDQDNTLVVRVSAPWDIPNPNGSYPSDHVLRGLVKGLYEHGEGVIPPDVNPVGIWRPVYLLFDQGISIDRIRIRTGTDGNVALRLTITNATNAVWNGTLHLDIAPENHQGSGTSVQFSLRLPTGTHDTEYTLRVCDPGLWWPWDQGEPHLYRLTARLREPAGRILSTQTETFGFRNVHLERTPQRLTYFINEHPVFVRGSSYIPALYLSQCNQDSLAHDLHLARDANLNLLRVHVHVAPPELYDLCDRMGMLVWQDFELNWIHDPSPEFEVRARSLQQDMIESLYNHPSIITWSCHNEPTMIFARRDNLEKHPDPALYTDALEQDPTRPVFLCSGQMEHDWRRCGDEHTYYGAIWTARYTDVYRHHSRLNTEFGFEAPAHRSTLQAYPACWERLQHLDGQIETLWAYQAELIRFHIEYYRRLRADGCAGYIHFWLVDLVPQVGCGVLDSNRQPKGGYDALRRASQPLQVALEHDGRRIYALWVFNDTPKSYPRLRVCWTVHDADGHLVCQDQMLFDVSANASQRVMEIHWLPEQCAHVDLALQNMSGDILASNHYDFPLSPMTRPPGYPWKFDPYLGVKVFNRPDAPSLADQTTHPIAKLVPLAIREKAAEWVLRQRLPPWLVQLIAQLIGRYYR
jgi:beta-mannosidase